MVKKIVVFNLIFFFISSPLCPVVNLAFPNYTHIGIGQHEMQLSELIGTVPPNASILTQDNIFPQVSNRVNAFVIPKWYLPSTIGNLALSFTNETIEKVDYVLVDNETDPFSAGVAISLLGTNSQFILEATRDNGIYTSL